MENKDAPLAGIVTPKSKHATILGLFCKGQSLNRFEAEGWHDHCLNSTVSAFQNGHGISIDSSWETVPCLGGRSTVKVKRYRLKASPENIKAAHSLLAMMERRP
jgi:hypothetical protein